jgi:hypothetical protein
MSGSQFQSVRDRLLHWLKCHEGWDSEQALELIDG